MLFRLLIFSSGFLCAGSFGSVHSREVVVLYQPVFSCRSMVCEFGKRFVLVELAFCCAVFRVASNYAPNRNPDRDVFFVRCFNAIELHPGVCAFTWCRPHGALGSRIDLIGYPYVWVPHVSSVDILPCSFSDQCALSFSWVLPDSVPMGPGLWKLNLATLVEDKYVSLITDFWIFWQRCQSDLSRGGGTLGNLILNV